MVDLGWTNRSETTSLMTSQNGSPNEILACSRCEIPLQRVSQSKSHGRAASRNAAGRRDGGTRTDAGMAQLA